MDVKSLSATEKKLLMFYRNYCNWNNVKKVLKELIFTITLWTIFYIIMDYIIANYMEKRHFKDPQYKQFHFTAIWNLLHTSEDQFESDFEKFKTNFSLYYDSFTEEEEKCFLNRPHCSICQCTPLFATIIAAQDVLEKAETIATKEEVIKRFEKIALYLACGNFHLDYRINFHPYFENNQHIKSLYKGGGHHYRKPKKEFLTECKQIFGENKKQEFEKFKVQIEGSIANICNHEEHADNAMTIKYYEIQARKEHEKNNRYKLANFCW